MNGEYWLLASWCFGANEPDIWIHALLSLWLNWYAIYNGLWLFFLSLAFYRYHMHHHCRLSATDRGSETSSGQLPPSTTMPSPCWLSWTDSTGRDSHSSLRTKTSFKRYIIIITHYTKIKLRELKQTWITIMHPGNKSFVSQIPQRTDFSFYNCTLSDVHPPLRDIWVWYAQLSSLLWT